MIKGILLDLSGVLYVDDVPVHGAVDAISRLQSSGLPHCYITNTSRRTQEAIQQALSKMGFDISKDVIFTASTATLSYVKNNNLRPHLLIHPNLMPDFSDLDTTNPDVVVLGDAAEAFRVLMKEKTTQLISMGYNRYFMESGGLSLDLGAFTAALEFSSGKQAIIMGKPSKEFFLEAVNKLGCNANETLMIGDDIYSDVEGAMKAGLQGCLVKTGKYQSGDEEKIFPPPEYAAQSSHK